MKKRIIIILFFLNFAYIKSSFNYADCSMPNLVVHDFNETDSIIANSKSNADDTLQSIRLCQITKSNNVVKQYIDLENLYNTNEYPSFLMQDTFSGNLYVVGYTNEPANRKKFLRCYTSDSTQVWTIGHAAWHIELDSTDGDYVGFHVHKGVITLCVFDILTLDISVVKIDCDDIQCMPRFVGKKNIIDIFPDIFIDQNNIKIVVTRENNYMVLISHGSILYTALFDMDMSSVIGSFETDILGTKNLSIQQAVVMQDSSVMVLLHDNNCIQELRESYLVCVNKFCSQLEKVFDQDDEQVNIFNVFDFIHKNQNIKLIKPVVLLYAQDEQTCTLMVLEDIIDFDHYISYTIPFSKDYDDILLTRTTGQPGTLNATNNLGVAGSPAISNGFAGAVFVYPAGNANAGKVLVGIDNGSNTTLARFTVSGSTLTLDSSFGTNSSGIYTGFSRTISCISIDAQNNILVCGTTQSSVGWAYRINDSGSAASVISFTGILSGVAFKSVTRIYQQKSGRYILAGSCTNSNNVSTTTVYPFIAAFQDKLIGAATTLAVDTTFNPLGANINGTPTSANFRGIYMSSVSGTTFRVVIASNDTIYAIYGTTTISLLQLTANGFSLVASFGSSGQVSPISITPSTSTTNRTLALDGNSNILVGTTNAANILLTRYTSAGAITTFGSSGVATITASNFSGLSLGSIVPLTNNGTLFIGSNSGGGVPDGTFFAGSLTSTGALDQSWDVAAASPSKKGLLNYTISGSDGSVGTGSAGAVGNSGVLFSLIGTGISGSVPVLTQVEGYGSGITQVSQAPLESPAGALDTTMPNLSTGLPNGANGGASLSGIVTGIPQKVSIYNNSTNTTNGAVIIASSNGANSYLTMLNANLAAITSPTYGTSGVVTFTGKTAISDMYLTGSFNSSTLAPILVTGTSSSAMWGANVSSDGLTTTYLASTSGFTEGNVIRQTTNGRILVGGKNDSGKSAIAAFGSVTSGGVYPLDTTFGNGNGSGVGTGIYAISGNSNGIYDMAVDSLNRIYIAYKTDNTTLSVVRLLANGTAVDTTFNATFTTGTTYSASQIRLALDMTNSQLVVAAQDGASNGNIIQVCKFSISDGTLAGATSTVTLTSQSLSLVDLFIDASQKIYLIGTVTTNGSSGYIARLTSAVALDGTYAATNGWKVGIGNISMQDSGGNGYITITAGAYNPDRRTYLVGYYNNGVGNPPYIGRAFGDIYTSQVSEAISAATVGSIDTSLQPNNTGGIDLSGQTNWSSLSGGYKAQAIIENLNGNGTSFIAFGNGTNLIVGKVNADMVPMTSFGTNGLTTALAMATVNSIMVDASGNILVAGIDNSAQKVVSFSSSGVLNATFASTVASTVGTKVAQQKSGRYIVSGYSNVNNLGILTAFKNMTAVSGGILPVDSTFGSSANSGFYTTSVATQIDDFVIDSQDNIYIVYRNASNNVLVDKITAQGGGKVTSSNSPTGFTSISINVTATQPARIAINGAGNILVGFTIFGAAQVALYDGSTGGVIKSAFSVLATNSPVLTGLVGSVGSTNEFYGSIYTTATTIAATVFAINSAGNLDSAFNPSFGYNTTQVQSPVQVNGIAIQPDGKVVVVGYNNAGASSTPNPILLRFYGYPYVGQTSQMPLQANAGLIDTTLWPTVGALQLSSYSPISTTITTLTGSTTKCVYEYSNGKALFVCDGTSSGANTVLMRVNKDLTLDTSFNNSGTQGYVTITGKTGVGGLFVDSSGNIYVVGGTSTGWIYACNSSGTTLWSSPLTVALATSLYQVSIQSNGRVILAGKATNGQLWGYTFSGEVDITFGRSGVVDMGSTNPITDVTVDSNNRTIAVSNNSGTVVLQRVSADGTTVTTLTGGTAITGVTSGSNVKVVLDATANIVVASATATGYVLRSYNNDATGTNILGGLASITIGTTPVLGNIYATSDGKISLVGYDATTGNVIAARFISSGSGLSLDSTFNPSTGYIASAIGSLNRVYDGIISADDRIMVAGGNGTTANPYLGRFFGDTYVSYVSQGQNIIQPANAPGTINTTFGAGGSLNLSSLNAVLTNSQGIAILPVVGGGNYIALNNGNSGANSILIKTTAAGALDTTYNSGVTGGTAGIAGSATVPNYAPLGVNSILQDGSARIVLTGTTAGAGWVQRYTSSGALDTNFGAGTGKIASGTQATIAIEQTPARLLVAGRVGGFGSLSAYTSLAPDATYTGTVDTTFNSTGTTPGLYSTTSSNAIYSVVSDSYDRIIFAVLNSSTGNTVDLYRLTPSGQLDTTFGTGGIVAGAITSASGASSVRVALSGSGNTIVVASNSSTANTFSVKAFDNGTLTTAGGNGGPVYVQLNISSLTGPSVTNLVASTDSYAFVVGTQSGTNAAFVARITSIGLLNSAKFNTYAVGGVAGIFQYAGSGTTSHIYSGIAIDADSNLAMVGYENSSASYTPTLVSIYNDTAGQTAASADSKAVGTNDLTLGVSTTSTTNKGITFFGSSGANAASGQVARAISLYDDNNFVVAVDGNSTAGSGTSKIMMNMFDNDGIPNSSFGTSGKTTVLSRYQNQYVNDMVTFTTSTGVCKAILAGYVYNSTINKIDSLLLQYTLTPGSQGLDTTFGGYDGNPLGVALGDGKQLFSVSRQSLGRIIVAGLSQDNLGLLLGYTSNGKMDASFGNNGYQSTNTGTTGIYTHAVDSNNCIVFAYNNGSNAVAVARYLPDGSALDSSFTMPTGAQLISTVSGNSNMKIALNSSNQIYVAAITNAGNTIAARLYANSGGTALQSAALTGTQLGNASAVYTLARLIVDIAGKVIIAAYDSNAKQVVVVRLTSSLAFDTTFNSTGYITYQVAGGSTSQLLTSAMLHPDGRIIVTGSQE